MLNVLVLIRNIILVAIMSWLGLQAAPADQDEERAEVPVEASISGFFR